MISIRQLRYFEALATTLHFGRAAEMVHVSQPALSAQIMEMEKHLGVKLLERTRSNTLLTDKGHEVLKHARTVLSAVDRLEEAARRSSGSSAVMSVWMKPGATTLAVIPRPPSSREIERATPMRPDLLAA